MMDQNFYIIGFKGFDPSQVIYTIDHFISVLWTDRYDDTGDFEIQMYPTNEAVEAVQKEHLVYNPSPWIWMNTMIIENIEIGFDESSGNKLLKFSGKSLESYIGRRILVQKTVFRNGLLFYNLIHTVRKHFQIFFFRILII